MELQSLPPRDHHALAVSVRDAYKQYGDLHVLADLNMSVRRGVIYGLLGASGCGKTTLLSCVVGRRRLDKGEVRVLGGPPCSKGRWLPYRKLGYMPQGTALYNNFSTRETLRYFGWIFEMSSQASDKRLEFLMKLLDLPDSNQMVKTLSGGQARRVSLAVALLHEPEVLILDEPTVGMDPVLRAVVWDHLLQLSSQQATTVILTTHYIEEASQAHTIGLLRNGRLLDEDNPIKLLSKYGVSSLEEVFLHLSLRQEAKTDSMVSTMDCQDGRGRMEGMDNGTKEIVSENAESRNGSSSKSVRKTRTKDYCGILSKGSMRALLFKNVVCTTRDPSYMAFIFGLCIVAVSGLYAGFGFAPRQLRLAVVNHDLSAADPRCGLPLQHVHNCTLEDLSCRYLSHVAGPTIVKEYYDNTESAVRSVMKGRSWGVLYFHENFTQSLVELASERTLASDEALEYSSVQVRLDMSNQVIGWLLREQLYSKYIEFSEEMLAACGINTKIANIPVQFKEPVYGKSRPTFIDYTAPAIISTMMFFFGVALSVWGIAYERNQGLLERNFIAGIKSFEIFLGYFLSQSILMCGQATLLIVLGIFAYHFQCDGELALVIFLCLLQGISGMCMGFVISAACENEVTATVVASGSIQPMLYLCGLIWPLEGMHFALRYVAVALPLTLPIRAMRAIMNRAWGLASSEVALGFTVSFAWIVAFIAICSIIVHFKKL